MLFQKMKAPLLGVIVVAVVILLTVAMIDPNGLIVQAQGETNSLGQLKLQQGQLEEVDDLESLILNSIQDSSIDPQSTNSGTEVIPTSAFRHDGTNGNGFRFWPYSGYLRNRSSSLMCLSAPVYVPDGVTMTRFSMYFVDDSPSDIEARLYRKNHAFPTSTAELISSMFFSGIDESTIFVGWDDTFEPGTETVSNNYGYSIAFCFDANTSLDQRIYGFSVDYDFMTLTSSNF